MCVWSYVGKFLQDILLESNFLAVLIEMTKTPSDIIQGETLALNQI